MIFVFSQIKYFWQHSESWIISRKFGWYSNEYLVEYSVQVNTNYSGMIRSHRIMLPTILILSINKISPFAISPLARNNWNNYHRTCNIYILYIHIHAHTHTPTHTRTHIRNQLTLVMRKFATAQLNQRWRLLPGSLRSNNNCSNDYKMPTSHNW